MKLVARHDALKGFYVLDENTGKEKLISYDGTIELIRRGEITGYEIIEHEGALLILGKQATKLSELPERKARANVEAVNIDNEGCLCKGASKDGTIKTMKCDLKMAFEQTYKGKISNLRCGLGIGENQEKYRVLTTEK